MLDLLMATTPEMRESKMTPNTGSPTLQTSDTTESFADSYKEAKEKVDAERSEQHSGKKIEPEENANIRDESVKDKNVKKTTDRNSGDKSGPIKTNKPVLDIQKDGKQSADIDTTDIKERPKIFAGKNVKTEKNDLSAAKSLLVVKKKSVASKDRGPEESNPSSERQATTSHDLKISDKTSDVLPQEGRAMERGLAGQKEQVLSVSNDGRVQIVDQRVVTEKDSGSKRTHERGRGKIVELRTESSDASTGFGAVKANTVETDINLSSPKGMPLTEESAAQALARKLDAQAGSEIVRQVKVVLNRAEAGQIRINLRPDNLGQVRVHIQLDDNKLTGRIFVESAAAREAFRASLDGLQTRLVESGFNSANLEMAWDEKSMNYFSDNRSNKDFNGSNPRFSENMEQVIENFDTFAGRTADSWDGRINMVV